MAVARNATLTSWPRPGQGPGGGASVQAGTRAAKKPPKLPAKCMVARPGEGSRGCKFSRDGHGDRFGGMTGRGEYTNGFLRSRSARLAEVQPAHTGSSRSRNFTCASARGEVPDFLPASWGRPRSRDLVGPSLELTAEAAILLQLSCLQNNDTPYPDHGVEVMYRFASFDPFQRSRYFGPLLDLGQFERFRRLFHHATFRVLLCHKEHQVLSSFPLSPGRLKQRVRVFGVRPGEEEVFEFTVVQREGGSWDGYWFTESLIHDGEGLNRGVAY